MPSKRFHWCILAVLLPAALTAEFAAGSPKPLNLILMLGDDLGYGDLGVTGSRQIITPHLDSMAASGARFINAYAPTPARSLSRPMAVRSRPTRKANSFPAKSKFPAVALSSLLGACAVSGEKGSSPAMQDVEEMLKIGVPQAGRDSDGRGGSTKVPRVLLVGDSISGGYVGPVQKLLKGRAFVARGSNGGPSTAGQEALDKVLGDEPWDIIHFNWGLHDMTWQFRMAAKDQGVDQYAARLEQLVLRLKKTGAKLVWATTTPWCPETYQYVKQRYHRELQFSAEDEKAWRNAALAVMKKHDVEVNDLHALLLPNLRDYLNKPDDIHFNAKGNEVMARQIAALIEKFLPRASGEARGAGSRKD